MLNRTIVLVADEAALQSSRIVSACRASGPLAARWVAVSVAQFTVPGSGSRRVWPAVETRWSVGLRHLGRYLRQYRRQAAHDFRLGLDTDDPVHFFASVKHQHGRDALDIKA